MARSIPLDQMVKPCDVTFSENGSVACFTNPNDNEVVVEFDWGEKITLGPGESRIVALKDPSPPSPKPKT